MVAEEGKYGPGEGEDGDDEEDEDRGGGEDVGVDEFIDEPGEHAHDDDLARTRVSTEGLFCGGGGRGRKGAFTRRAGANGEFGSGQLTMVVICDIRVQIKMRAKSMMGKFYRPDGDEDTKMRMIVRDKEMCPGEAGEGWEVKLFSSVAECSRLWLCVVEGTQQHALVEASL